MPLALTSDDLARLDVTTGVLLSPLAAPSVDAWREGVSSAFCTLLEADGSLFLLPLAEGPYVYSPDLPAGFLERFRHFTEEPALKGAPSDDPHVTRYYRQRPALGIDIIDYATVDRLLGGALARSPFHNEVLLGNRLRAVSALHAEVPAGPAMGDVMLAAFYDREIGAARSERARGLLRVLKPALRAGLDALARLGAARAALDVAGVPLAAYDPEGRALHRTPALERLLAADPHRDRIDAVAGALARGTAAVALRRPRPTATAGADVARREAATPLGRYVLRATVLAASPFGGSGAVLVTVERAGAPTLPTAAEARERFGLSAREAEVALLIAEGLRNDAIAARLGLSPHTVRRHTEGVMRALLIESRSGVAGRLLGLA